MKCYLPCPSRYLHISISTQFNAHCQMCWIWQSSNAAEVRAADWRRSGWATWLVSHTELRCKIIETEDQQSILNCLLNSSSFNTSYLPNLESMLLDCSCLEKQDFIQKFASFRISCDQSYPLTSAKLSYQSSTARLTGNHLPQRGSHLPHSHQIHQWWPACVTNGH